MEESTSILVTGGSGLVGAHSAKSLVDEDFDVVCFDFNPRQIDFIPHWNVPVVRGDVRKIEDILGVIEQYSITEIVHTAAIASELACKKDPIGTFEVNVKGTLNVAEASRLKDLRLIYVSSQAVYGNLHGEDLTSIKEEEISQSIYGVYGSHKMVDEIIVRSYAQLYGLSTLILRPTWVYGPGQTAVQNPVSMILEKAVKKQPFILERGGDHPLNYTYVKDFAQATLLSVKAKHLKESIFNIDGGKLVTVRQVAEAVKKIVPDFHFEVGPGYWPTIAQQAPVRGASDITRAREELGYEPRYSIDMGVREFAQYLFSQMKTT